MRNIAEIIEDDRNGKQLSQTERQIAVAYAQGKYDAVRELKIGNNNAMEVLDRVRAEIEALPIAFTSSFEMKQDCLDILDKYKGESEG